MRRNHFVVVVPSANKLFSDKKMAAKIDKLEIVVTECHWIVHVQIIPEAMPSSAIVITQLTSPMRDQIINSPGID